MILQDPAALTAPSSVVRFRDKQINELNTEVFSHIDYACPSHLVVQGNSGTGKTFTINHVVNSLPEEKRGRVFYFSCNQSVTPAAGATALYEKILGGKPKGQDMLATLEEIAERLAALQSKPIVIIFDEFDKWKNFEIATSGRFLYPLLRAQENHQACCITVILIVNDLYYYDNFEAAVKSSLGGAKVFFIDYSKEDLCGILQDRAEKALTPGSARNEVLAYIADLSVDEAKKTDARFAIKILLKTAFAADAQHATVLNKDHVKEAFEQVMKTEALTTINRMEEAQKILTTIVYDLYLSGASALTPQVFLVYERLMLSLRRPPLSERQIHNQLENLVASSSVMNSFVQSTTAGRPLLYVPASHYQHVLLPLLLEDLNKRIQNFSEYLVENRTLVLKEKLPS